MHLYICGYEDQVSLWYPFSSVNLLIQKIGLKISKIFFMEKHMKSLF